MLSAPKLSFYLIAVSILFGCVKKKQEAVPNYGIYSPPIVLADYCYFKTGSYWVYKDSVSGVIDCVYVKNAYVQTYDVLESANKGYTGTFHHYYVKTMDGIGDEREYDIYDEDAVQTAKCCGGRYNCQVHWNRPSTTTQAGHYYGSYTYVFNDFTPGITGGVGSGEQCWFKASVGTMTLNNMSFMNVVQFENSINVADINWSVHPYRFMNYISKGVGAIKRIDLDSNRVWKVKTYKIN